MTAIEFQYELVKLQDNLMRFAKSLTSNPEDAKDLVQDTFLKALTFRNNFDDTNMKAWAFTILKNTHINNYRRAIKQNQKNDSNYNEFLLNSISEKTSPETEYSYNEITKKIEELNDNFRVPFQMHASGYKYKEIAKNLNLNIGTVKSRIFLSRKQLMTLINL